MDSSVLPAGPLTAIDREAAAALALLETIGQGKIIETPGDKRPRVMNISIYCYKSFAVRGFHALSLACGIEIDSVFFKETLDNQHRPVSETETELLLDLVRERRPDLITMSVMAPYVIVTRALIERLRAVTDAPIVLGGKFPTISPGDALEFADYACQGEGELVLVSAFERLKAGRDLKDIRGLWYREGDGQVVDMGQQRLFDNIDIIPFQSVADPDMYFIEYDRITMDDPEVFNPNIWVMAGRGCVYLCSYCVNSLLIPMNRGNGRFIRMRSPDSIIDEIIALREKQPNARAVAFNDEVFGVFDEWTDEFCAKYKERVALPFNCELIPKLIKEHNIRLLADAGMEELHFGIQSGSDELRNKVLHRPGSNSEMIEKAEMLTRYEVRPEYDIILGNPFDTEAALEDAVNLLLALPRPIVLDTFKLSYFPHYPLTMRALKEGHITERDVTYEKIADAVMNNFFFIPRVSLRRRDHLEAAIYVLPWDSALLRFLAGLIARRPIVPVGLLLGVIAVARYRQTFLKNPWLNAVRRVVLGVKLLMSGEFRGLYGKFMQVAGLQANGWDRR